METLPKLATMTNEQALGMTDKQVDEMLKKRALSKLKTMTNEQALILKGKIEKREDLTEEDTQTIADELIAQAELWIQRTKALEEGLRKIQHPPKKWWQFWK